MVHYAVVLCDALQIRPTCVQCRELLPGSMDEVNRGSRVVPALAQVFHFSRRLSLLPGRVLIQREMMFSDDSKLSNNVQITRPWGRVRVQYLRKVAHFSFRGARVSHGGRFNLSRRSCGVPRNPCVADE